jgi:uncharacterized membrane protein YgcG
MSDIRREEDEISRRVARSAERITKFRESEAQLFRQLAQLRLDPALQAELDGQISSAEARARDMLKAHARDVTAAESSMADLDRRRSALVEQRRAAQHLLDDRQAELGHLSASAESALRSDPTFSARLREAEELDQVAEQSMRKTEQAEADRDEKGRPYRDDPLFLYLWDKGFGTSDYKAGPLVRYLDGLVAGLVDYNKARPNYAMLNEIPTRLREHAEQQEARAEAAEAALAALQSDAVDAAGGKPLREAIAAIEGQIEALDAQIVACEDQRDEAVTGLQALAEGQDPAFQQATSDLAAALEREDIRTLLAEARQTRSGQDDTIIAQIDDIQTRLREEEEESREQRERLKTLASRRRELEDIQWEFKKQRFDDPQSSFGEDRLVGDLLDEFLRGGISAASYWDQWRKSQNWAPGQEWGAGYRGTRQSRRDPPRPSNSGFDWPRGGRPRGGFGGGWSGGNAGGGFSRPRSGSMGRNGKSGGGFRTGGGF